MAYITHDFEIRFKDTKNNKLTNQGFLSFMENIAGMHSEMVGYGSNDISRTRLSWILLGWKVHIFKRPIYGEPVSVKTWSGHAEKFHSYRDFEIYDKDKNLVAIASSKWVLVNIDTGRITKLTEDIMEKYQSEETHVFEQVEFDKLKEPNSFSYTYLYKVLRMNIDINDHMHNLDYLDLAYEALPDEVYKNENFDRFEIMYKHEIKFGNTVKCLYSKEEDGHYVTIKSEDESVFHAIVKLY